MPSAKLTMLATATMNTIVIGYCTQPSETGSMNGSVKWSIVTPCDTGITAQPAWPRNFSGGEMPRRASSIAPSAEIRTAPTRIARVVVVRERQVRRPPPRRCPSMIPSPPSSGTGLVVDPAAAGPVDDVQPPREPDRERRADEAHDEGGDHERVERRRSADPLRDDVRHGTSSVHPAPEGRAARLRPTACPRCGRRRRRARQDVADVVQLPVDRGAVDLDVGVRGVQRGDALRRGDDRQQPHRPGALLLAEPDGVDGRAAGGEHRVEQQDLPLGQLARQLRVVDDGLQRLLVAVHAEEADPSHRDHRRARRRACRRRPAGSAPRRPSCRTPCQPEAVSSGVVTSTALELQLARRLVRQHPRDLRRQQAEVAGGGGDVAQQRHLVADERVVDLDDDGVRHRPSLTRAEEREAGICEPLHEALRGQLAPPAARARSRSTSRHWMCRSRISCAAVSAGGVSVSRMRRLSRTRSVGWFAGVSAVLPGGTA